MRLATTCMTIVLATSPRWFVVGVDAVGAGIESM